MEKSNSYGVKVDMTFEERFLFEKYKDTAFKNCQEFRILLRDFEKVDVYKIYTAINKYQIKKYGKSLDKSYERIDCMRAAENRKSRRKDRGFTNNAKKKRWTDYEKDLSN